MIDRALAEAAARPAAAAGHLSVVEQLYHEAPDHPTPHGHQFSRRLETDEQAYSRTLKVGPDWRPLDCGWVRKVGMLLLVNAEGRFRTVQPTEGERAEAAGRVVEVAFLSALGGDLQPALLLRPGESQRYEPADAGAIRLRCRGGMARVLLTLIPA